MSKTKIESIVKYSILLISALFLSLVIVLIFRITKESLDPSGNLATYNGEKSQEHYVFYYPEYYQISSKAAEYNYDLFYINPKTQTYINLDSAPLKNIESEATMEVCEELIGDSEYRDYTIELINEDELLGCKYIDNTLVGEGVTYLVKIVWKRNGVNIYNISSLVDDSLVFENERQDIYNSIRLFEIK